MGKKQSPLRITFLCKTSQPMSIYRGDVAQRNTFFTEHLPMAASGLCLFSFGIDEGRRAFGEEENEFLQRDITENSNNLVENQEQVTVSSISLVMKASPSSCCSSKSQISNRSSSIGSRE